MTAAQKQGPIVFEGREFVTRAEFIAAFPAYRSYVQQIRSGIGTIEDLERHIAAAAARARFANRSAIHAARLAIRFGGRRDPSCK